MKKIYILLLSFLLLNCSDDINSNNCFLGVFLNETENLSNPEFIDIQVPGGSTITTIGGRRVLIIRRTNTSFKAFDLECPNGNCSSPMTFDGLRLVCSCNNDMYSTLNGCPVDENGECIRDGSCFALEYTALLAGNVLQIRR